ncbi:MAG TPA: DUF2950 family protein [Terriglobia bacterium]|nr:DUF2950 family protein [Terriglobia bacterium]
MSREAERVSLLPFCVMTAILSAMLIAMAVPAKGQSTASSQASSSSSWKASPQAPSKPRARSAPGPRKGKTFSSAQQAAAALYEAARKHDENGIVVILGPESRDLIFWTNDVGDRTADIDQFVKKYEQMHRLVQEPDDETTLYVGAENWPLPIPLVEQDGVWSFDNSLGRKEILYRRIGENETSTLDVLRALVDAEQEYYDQSAAPGGTPQYAGRLNSDQGEHDGLYWPESNETGTSPVGPYVAQASYNRSDRKPFHGYYIRMLTGQGRDARGGAHKYRVDGRITGGFAFVAFPAEYRSSGVKTLIVNQDGIIYEKDLGPATTKIAAAMTVYNPDPSWKSVL